MILGVMMDQWPLGSFSSCWAIIQRSVSVEVHIIIYRYTSTPQLPFKEPQIPSTRDHKAINRVTLGGLGIYRKKELNILANTVLRELTQWSRSWFLLFLAA